MPNQFTLMTSKRKMIHDIYPASFTFQYSVDARHRHDFELLKHDLIGEFAKFFCKIIPSVSSCLIQCAFHVHTLFHHFCFHIICSTDPPSCNVCHHSVVVLSLEYLFSFPLCIVMS